MLKAEIENASRLVKTDAYQVSLGEIVNMYKDKELVINPDFQRLFRWEIGQKSKLIESILLGIPIPSIFVFERADATWELIDGLQRISTILEFMGLLRDEHDHALAPSVLEGTKYLPSLSNAVWEKSNAILDVPIDAQNALDSTEQLTIRRARLSVEILKRPSDNATKYDLFQRLNAGGTPANAQELRNAIVIMVSPDYSVFLKTLAEYPAFRTVLAASEDQLERQRHLEYVSRFLVHTYIPYDNKLDVEEFIDEGVIQLATGNERQASRLVFERTFGWLSDALGDNALRRQTNGNPQGKVGLAAFEAIAVGIARNVDTITLRPDPVQYVRDRIAAFWASNQIGALFTAGMRGTTRLQRTVPFGTNWFSV